MMTSCFYILFLLLANFFVINYGIRSIDVDFDFKVSEIHRLLRSKKWNCTDVIHYFLERSYTYNPLLNSIINYNPRVLAEALELDKYYYQNDQRFIGKLHCIPLLVKDNIDVKGIPTTCGIKALRYSIPNTDATIIEKLKREGGLVIAKSNLAELSIGKYESELGGICKNPHDLTRTCGSANGGTGAGIASGMAIIGVGFDTEGSMMSPSTASGIYGLRPSIGDLSNNGIITVFDGQDTAGPLTRYVDDIVLSYSIMMGRSDAYDDYQNHTLSKFKIGYFKRFFTSFNLSNEFGNFSYFVDDQVNKALMKAVDKLKDLKFEIIPIEMPITDFKKFIGLSVGIVIASSNVISACIQKSYDKYFQDNNRFDSDAPYHNFESFINSSQLSDEWKSYFSGIVLNDTKNECKLKIENYQNFKKQYIDFFDYWFGKEDVQMFLFPTSNSLPHKLNETEDAINVSPSILSPFLGYPSLNMPIDFSIPTKNSSAALPIGMLMLTNRNNLFNVLKLASIYEKTYLKSTNLPKATPLIIRSSISQPKCPDFLFLSSNNVLRHSAVYIIFCLFIVLLLGN